MGTSREGAGCIDAHEVAISGSTDDAHEVAMWGPAGKGLGARMHMKERCGNLASWRANVRTHFSCVEGLFVVCFQKRCRSSDWQNSK